jgi:hypothetical protein
MSQDNACTEANALMQRARPDQLHETLRLRACEVAHCERYRETLPLDELAARIAVAPQDPAGAELVSLGMTRLGMKT